MATTDTLQAINGDKYAGQWVALDPETDEVKGHGATISEARHAAEEHGLNEPVFFPVPKSDAYFVGGA